MALLTMLQGHQLVSETPHEIADIITAAEATPLTVSSWELIGTDKLTEEKMHQLQESITRDGYLEKRVEKAAVIIHTYEKIVQDKINVEIRMIQNKGDLKDIRLHVVVNGEEWTPQIERIFDEIIRYLNVNVFSDLVAYFACVKFVDDGIIDYSMFVNEIYENLKVEHKSEQFDTIDDSKYEVGMYGYNHSWNSRIQMNNTQVNMQVIVGKVMNNKRQTIIGTPAILNEY